jgi:DNA gyrase subunit A
LARSFLSLDPGERVVAIVPISAFSEEIFLVVFTGEGRVKKTALSEYLKIDEKGSPDLKLLGKDTVVCALLSLGWGDYVVTTSDAKTLRFSDADLRPTGRVGQGVQAINLSGSAGVVGAESIGEDDDRTLWVASSNGFIKRSPLADYPRKGRGTGGVATMQLTPKTSLTGSAVIGAGEDGLLIAESGRTARVTANDLPLVARDRRGVVGIKLDATDRLRRLVVLPS